MSESLDGVSVAATRQNAGSDAYTRGCCTGVPPCRAAPGGVKAPAATSCAIVIFALSSVSRASDSQVAAYDEAGIQRPTPRTPGRPETTARDITCFMSHLDNNRATRLNPAVTRLRSALADAI